MEADIFEDETARLHKLASKISRYIDKDNDDKLRTVLDILRAAEHSLAALDTSGVGKLVKKLSKREDAIGHVANKLIKKWKKQAERNEDLVHASAHQFPNGKEHGSSSIPAEVTRNDSRKTLHGSSNSTPSKALTADKLAEAERLDPAYAAILQKFYAISVSFANLK